MSDLGITALLIVALFLILGSGVWIGLTLSGVAWIGMQLFSSRPAGDAMAVTIWGSASSWTLTALPLFVWMGEILFRTRLSQDMFRGLAPWMQALPGRLLHVNVAGCAIFAAVSGSSAATCATIGKMSLPELARRGYPDGISIGSLAGAGTLGLLIPPSIIMIVYGVSAEVSIAQLFIAGVLPGILLALLFSGYLAAWALLHPDQVPPRDAPLSFGAKLRESRHLIPVLLLIAAVLGSIYSGIATATEAAALGVLGSLIISAAQGSLTWQTFKDSLLGGHAAVLHDRADPVRRGLPDAGHGLHRPAAPPGRMDRDPGSEPLRPAGRAAAVLRRARLFPGRHQHGGADDGRDPADDPEGRHRPAVVRHLHRAGGGDGADHTAGGLQPVRAAGHDEARDRLDRARDAAVLLRHGAGGRLDLPVPAALSPGCRRKCATERPRGPDAPTVRAATGAGLPANSALRPDSPRPRIVCAKGASLAPPLAAHAP